MTAQVKNNDLANPHPQPNPQPNPTLPLKHGNMGHHKKEMNFTGHSQKFCIGLFDNHYFIV